MLDHTHSVSDYAVPSYFLARASLSPPFPFLSTTVRDTAPSYHTLSRNCLSLELYIYPLSLSAAATSPNPLISLLKLSCKTHNTVSSQSARFSPPRSSLPQLSTLPGHRPFPCPRPHTILLPISSSLNPVPLQQSPHSPSCHHSPCRGCKYV